MLIVPELERVIILVPRTGSGSLRRAVLQRYPRALQLYRHMEADGVPAGYDRWTKIGVLRNPFDRLWSLYKFLQTFGGDHDPAYVARMRDSVQRSFSDWVIHNEVPFTTPYDATGQGRYWPQFTVRHPMPENRKSQFVYLRPDLGTQVVHFSELDALFDRLGLDPSRRENETAAMTACTVTAEAMDHMQTWFRWDFAMDQELINQAQLGPAA